MTTLTITQRIQEGDAVIDRTVSYATEEPGTNLIERGVELITLLRRIEKTSPDTTSQ